MHPPAVRHSDSLLLAWRLAELEAAHLRQEELEPAHFFLGLLKLVELDVNAILTDNTTLSSRRIQEELACVERLGQCFHAAGLETTATRRRLRRSLPRGTAEMEMGRRIRRSAAAREMFAVAERSLEENERLILEPLHLLEAVLATECPWIVQTLDLAGADIAGLGEVAAKVLSGTEPAPVDQVERKERRKTGLAAPAREAAKGLADRLGRDLTELARSGSLPPVIGRKDEMRSLVQTLLRSRKNNAILTGEAGVGKTGIVEGLAQRIAEGAVPPEFADKRIVEISMGSLVAGTNLRGDMEERLQAVIAQAKRDDRLILFIDEIHLLVGAGAGSGSAMDAANLLKPALARGEVCVIGATTTQEYRKHIETDAALARRFEVIEVSEPSRAETLAILDGLRSRMEEHHGVKIGESALEAAVDLTVRYLPMRRLPDKAIDVLDQACAQARMQSLSGDFRAQFQAGLSIERKQVAAAVAHRCKVPVGDIEDDEAAKLLRLEEELGERIKGQPEAVEAVSHAIRLAKSGLGQPGRPLSVLLFAGPTGTGKTELAKALADCLFGGADKGLIRIDMSELMEAHSVSKLIGSPPGFVGHDQGGQLTEQIRSRPHAVLLLDEMEKAHPRIFDLFLQVFDNGFLTDARGNRCDFRNHLIIMTTNLGAEGGKAAIGCAGERNGEELREERLTAALGKTFRAEFINRINEVVVFQPLRVEAAREILDMQLRRLNERLSAKNVEVRLSQTAGDWLLQRGFSESQGARHLQRVFDQNVVRPLSSWLLGGQRQNGAVILADVKDDGIHLSCLEEAH